MAGDPLVGRAAEGAQRCHQRRALVTLPRYNKHMIVEVLRSIEESGWQVTLSRANYRPERCFVEMSRDPGDADGYESWCVGYADDEARADSLFDTTVRTLQLVSTGSTESVDWAEIPEGIDFI